MPLIQCPDCGRDVSDSAPSCPGCGKPIANSSRSGSPVLTKPRIWQDRNAGCLGCAVLILGAAFALFYACGHP